MQAPLSTIARFAAALPLLLALTAQAAPRFEIIPFVGVRTGGGFDVVDDTTGEERSADLDDAASYGLGLGLRAHDHGTYDLLYATQEARLDASDPAVDGVDIRVDYLHVGGTALFPDDRFYVPYLSLGIGATLLEPQQGAFDSETKFSASIGGGFRFPLGEHAAVVLGLRGYLTFIDSDTDLFCISDVQQAGCLLRSSGSTFFQTEALLGLSAMF
jgi:hypothetical protein